MERTPEVCLITTDWEPQVPVLTIEYDQPSARALGLSRNDVSLSLLTATGGIPIGSFYEGIHKNNIYLKCLDEKGEPIEDLGNAQVFSSLPSLNGLLNEETMVKLKAGTLSKEDLVESIMGSTPLKQISKEIDIRWEDPVVPRYNGQRSQRAQCSPAPGIETEKARLAIAEQIENIPLPEGYSLVWQGEKIASDQSMKYLFQNFPLAIILMIAILIASTIALRSGPLCRSCRGRRRLEPMGSCRGGRAGQRQQHPHLGVECGRSVHHHIPYAV